jgi:hypothetical protein
LLQWFKRQFWPVKMERIPFSEVPHGATFWWGGEVYVKESEGLIFLHEPFPRPFPWREMVEVLPK